MTLPIPVQSEDPRHLGRNLARTDHPKARSRNEPRDDRREVARLAATKEGEVGCRANLFAHLEDDIGVAATQVPYGEVHTPQHPHLEQPQHVLSTADPSTSPVSTVVRSPPAQQNARKRHSRSKRAGTDCPTADHRSAVPTFLYYSFTM
ncbi:hypothetical protein BHE74_00023217 [Ensete ventricosum]|nr:hypothetical protein GW17_00004380 [Ensete ventricosum]RWW69201.1 hypothetical protein BHE74_00023217 [Ensete ventricosum]